MSLALSIAWRLLLALALVASPILGLASESGCAHASIQVQPAGLAHATAPEAMSGCTHMADMAPTAPQGKSAAPQGAPAHASCASGACCLGGAVAMVGVSLAVSAPPMRELLATPRETALASPPRGALLRPPIA